MNDDIDYIVIYIDDFFVNLMFHDKILSSA